MMLLAYHEYVGLSASPVSYLNSGRQNLQKGDIARAIHSEREGLRLDPTNRELQGDLAAARSLVTCPPAYARNDLDQLHYRVRESEVFVVLLVCIVLAAMGAIRHFTTRPRWAAAMAIASLMLAAGTAVVANNIVRGNRASRESPFAVISKETQLRTGNGVSYPARIDAPLVPGVEVVVLAQRGDWIQAELADGTIGWLPKSDVWLGKPAQVLRSESIH